MILRHRGIKLFAKSCTTSKWTPNLFLFILGRVMSGIIPKECNFPFTKLRFKTFLFLNIPNILLQCKTWKPSLTSPAYQSSHWTSAESPKGQIYTGSKPESRNQWPLTPTTQRQKELAVLSLQQSTAASPFGLLWEPGGSLLWLPGSIPAPAEQRRFGQLGWVTPMGWALRLGLDSLPGKVHLPATEPWKSSYQDKKWNPWLLVIADN